MRSKMYSQVPLSLVLGAFLGFFFSPFVPRNFAGFSKQYKTCWRRFSMMAATGNSTEMNILHGNKLLFIGVMTAEKYLDTRAEAINRTWASDIRGDVEFFMSSNASLQYNSKQMPIQLLRGLKDNEYPPQRKVMAMLRYMYENYLDEYQWFMRADDDLYVRVDKLKEFLRRLDSSKDTVVGQGGIGKPHEVHKLGLRKHECYCLGGAGVIMSRSVLKKIVPYAEKCLEDTVSNHEDVELGRCIRKYAGVSCLWALQAAELFRQVYEDPKEAFHGVLDEKIINKALTLHPVKEPAYMLRLHFYFLSMRLFKLHNRGYKTNGILSTTKKIISGEVSPKSFVNTSRNTEFYRQVNISTTLPWEFLRGVKSWYFKVLGLEFHKPYMVQNTLKGVRKGLKEIMNVLNANYKRNLGRKSKSKITLRNLDYGYMRINPKYGVQYQFLLSIKFPHDPFKFHLTPLGPKNHWAQLEQAFSMPQGRILPDVERATLHFIVPLREKYEELRRFLGSLKEAFLIHNEPVAVVVVYFPESSTPRKHIRRINELKLEFPQTKIVWLEIPGKFNRAKGLQKGAEHVGEDSLIFFSDVDLDFRREFVYRCRGNTIKGKQVYMPQVFSQYNPDIVYFNNTRPGTNFVYTKTDGLWRIYGYGSVCIYGSDVTAAGGLNTTIEGWGLEDTDFASRVVQHGLTIFRAPDPGIVHVYHEHVPCDKSLGHKQRFQCVQATASTYAPKAKTVDYLIAKNYTEQKWFS